MARIKAGVNPFYVVLVIAGTAFALTACAYGAMAVVKLEPARVAAQESNPHGLIAFMDRHGMSVLMVELAVLAVATFAAIGTDEFWMRRANRSAKQSSDGESSQ